MRFLLSLLSLMLNSMHTILHTAVTKFSFPAPPKSTAAREDGIPPCVLISANCNTLKMYDQTLRPKSSARGEAALHVRFDFGALFLSVHFLFGRAKRKWTQRSPQRKDKHPSECYLKGVFTSTHLHDHDYLRRPSINVLLYVFLSLRLDDLYFFHLSYLRLNLCPRLSEIDGGVRWGLNHVRSNFGETPFSHSECTHHSSPKFPARGERLFHAGFDFGLPSLVTFFGGAKKVTTLLCASPMRSVESSNEHNDIY